MGNQCGALQRLMREGDDGHRSRGGGLGTETSALKRVVSLDSGTVAPSGPIVPLSSRSAWRSGLLRGHACDASGHVAAGTACLGSSCQIHHWYGGVWG